MHKILLAEDDNDMRRFLVKALENAGFQVSSHDNGMSAYQRLREEPFEMLLTDIVMPEMHGPVLAERLRARRAELPVLFVSGYTEAMPSTATNDGRTAFLPKPFSADALIAAVRGALAAPSRPR